MAESFDVAIAGGGPVGAALALGLRASGLTVALIEAHVPGALADDSRAIALSHGSRLILERLGAWDALAPAVTPIRHITVSQQGSFGRTELTAAAARVPALGYVVGYTGLQRALANALASTPVRMLAGCAVQSASGEPDAVLLEVEEARVKRQLRARLLAIADGGTQLAWCRVRTRDYGQSALVCDVVSEQSHQNRAFERFTGQGPLALLPAMRGFAVIWTTSHEHAHELGALADAEFRVRLQAACGGAVGAISAVGRRQVFALALKYATQPVAPRMLLVGNASQTLHPVAGQGFNLGLRDAWELASAILAHGADDPGASALVAAYGSRRRFDRFATIAFTDSLIRLFCNDIPLLRGTRSLGLAALDAVPAAKRFLARRMMFGARG